ncbi:hypothetical protein ACFYXS_02785 [Streptomyces sp. NPDC002574]|uniref:hypothetical protein n=1 Tax=Streptomyces sp. NPDC002574 TaxID=3364652 RepID=UPI0036B83411
MTEEQSEAQYLEDYRTIEQELTAAQEKEFGAYVGWINAYGIRLRELAEKHPYPEGAFQHLQAYADSFLDRLHGN